MANPLQLPKSEQDTAKQEARNERRKIKTALADLRDTKWNGYSEAQKQAVIRNTLQIILRSLRDD